MTLHRVAESYGIPTPSQMLLQLVTAYPRHTESSVRASTKTNLDEPFANRSNRYSLWLVIAVANRMYSPHLVSVVSYVRRSRADRLSGPYNELSLSYAVLRRGGSVEFPPAFLYERFLDGLVFLRLR